MGVAPASNHCRASYRTSQQPTEPSAAATTQTLPRILRAYPARSEGHHTSCRQWGQTRAPGLSDSGRTSAKNRQPDRSGRTALPTCRSKLSTICMRPEGRWRQGHHGLAKPTPAVTRQAIGRAGCASYQVCGGSGEPEREARINTAHSPWRARTVPFRNGSTSPARLGRPRGRERSTETRRQDGDHRRRAPCAGSV